jgi:hypothetical protein
VGEKELNPAVGAATANVGFRVSVDRMRLFFSCDFDVLNLPGLYEQIATQLAGRGIVFTPDRASFDQMKAEALQVEAPRVTDFLLVSGEEAVEPQDGRLEWSRDYFDTHYPVDPKTGEIDFKNRVGNPSVSEGDLVVKVFPAKPGRPGKDLYGTSLPVRPPVAPRFIPTANVKWDEEAGGYRAVCPGRLSFRDHTLRIDPVLRIRGDVSTGTGNIQHNGSVFIQGDVDGGYSVQATGDIEIRGMVYAARINCGGNLAIAGGVNGNSCASIEVRGSVHAKFILNSTVRSHGEVVVEKEIYRSQVETAGEVKVRSGRIVGGEVVAARGITVRQAGSGSDPRTILAIRPDREILAGIQNLKKRVAESSIHLRALRQLLRDHMDQEALFSDAGKRKLAETAAAAAQLEEWIAAWSEEIRTTVHKLEEDQGAVIRVEQRLYPGVWFKIHHGDLRTDVEMLGPIDARLDRATGTIVLQTPQDLRGRDSGRP